MSEKKLARDPFAGKLGQIINITNINKDFICRTLTIKKEHLEKIRDKAYWDRSTQKEVLYNILEAYFKDKNIRPIPEVKLSQRD